MESVFQTISQETWSVPKYEVFELRERRSKYCVCIPIINEGDRIKNQLEKMKEISKRVDVILADGGSSDGSTEHSYLKSVGVRTLLVKKDKGKLSAQLRMAFAYALKQGYEGIITVDGNNKDSVESIDDFVGMLEKGYDFVQGSRYVPGGKEVNTPLSRKLAIKLIHAPFISMLARFHYTDTTNGFRAHSKRFLLDPQVNPFRDVFETYELLAYLSVQAPRKGYRTAEIPVARSYPFKEKTPTKISPLKGNLLLLKILWDLLRGRFDVK